MQLARVSSQLYHTVSRETPSLTLGVSDLCVSAGDWQLKRIKKILRDQNDQTEIKSKNKESRREERLCR